jgi:SAM-dependent methyltransferase
MGTYVFDARWHKEHDRLRALESLFDGYSISCLTALGVADGWQCLEVGCGAGSVARWLAGQVGTGRVVAVDLDTRFLDGHGRANLDVRQLDIVSEPLDDGPFDLAHARAVLEHIPERHRALERMISAVRPGGWLMLEDVDFAGPLPATLARYVDPPENAAAFERVYRACDAVFAAAGADAGFGARLIGELKRAGLENIGGQVHMPLMAGGTDNWTRGTIEQLRPRLVSTGIATETDVERALALTADPSFHYPPPAMITVWAQRP